MEFYRDEKGELTKLSQHNVDTGMGFERMCKVMQNKESVYETDLFTPFLEMLEKNTGLFYTENKRRFRIIAELTIKRVLLAEIAQFEKTLANGEKNLNDFLNKLEAQGEKVL